MSRSVRLPTQTSSRPHGRALSEDDNQDGDRGTEACFPAFQVCARSCREPYRRTSSRRLTSALCWRIPGFQAERRSCTTPPAERSRPHVRSEDPCRMPAPNCVIQANLQVRNGLLAALSPDDLSLLAPHLREVILLPGDLLHRPSEKIRTGLLSSKRHCFAHGGAERGDARGNREHRAGGRGWHDRRIRLAARV